MTEPSQPVGNPQALAVSLGVLIVVGLLWQVSPPVAVLVGGAAVVGAVAYGGRR